MRKVARIALLSAGAIFALLAVAFLAVNLYVQSQGTQARIQEELSQRLGATLRIQRISVTPWWGLKLTGITMPQDDGSIGADFLQAETFRLRVGFASLFSQRLVIKEISLVRPRVVWAQNASGKWRLPSSRHAEAREPVALEPAPPAPPVAQENASPAARPAVASASASPPETEITSPAAFTPEIRRVNLTGGDFRFLDANEKTVATFEGVRFRSAFRTATALRGNARIEKTSLRDRFFLSELQSPVNYDPAELDFSEITARAADGEIRGRFTMRPGDVGSPFAVMVKFRDLDADRLVKDAHGPAGMIQGRLEGHLDASGKTADPNALSGRGEIHLREGEVRQYSLLVALGQLLQIDELTRLQLDQAQVKYRIDPGVVTIDELVLNSPNIRLSATGMISFTGKLRLESQLAINERVRSQLFRPVRENFRPIDEAGYAAVNFQVTGTVERPKTNLMDKVVGEELKDLSGVISSFLGGGKSDKSKKKKPKEEAAPTPVPAPAAVSPQAAPTAPVPAGTPQPSASP
ncbi:MAG: AsmA-like C-terminal region-containing protein [Chthoniobacterales bacterium]